MGRYRWRWDLDNWPDQRINWAAMSRSQKAYTITQYNKQRSNKGIAAIPNPFNRNQNNAGNTIYRNDDGVETITPATVGRPRNQPISDSGPGPAIRGQGPIIDAFRNAQEQVNAREQQEIADIAAYFETDEGREFINGMVTQNNNAELAQFPGGTAPQRHQDPGQDQGAGPSRPDTSVPTEAPQEVEMSQGPPKRQRPDEAVAATAATAKGSSGGFDSTQGPVHEISKGGYSVNAGSMRYTKTHQFSTWANPYSVIGTGDFSGANLITTPLARIDWDYMYYYMSPEEFALIPAGSHVSDCSIEIISLVAQQGYATGGTISSVATTNHPKILCMGVDLENKMRGGIDRVLTFNNQMIPQTAVPPAAQVDDFILKQYGTDQFEPDASVVVAGVTTDIPYILKKHFCIYQPNKAQATARGFIAETAPGQEYFKNHIMQVNANDLTWSNLPPMNYSFTAAPIGAQFPALELQTDDVVQSLGSHDHFNFIRTATGLNLGVNKTITETILPSTSNTIPLVTYKSSRIEKGSHMVNGDGARTPSRQPTFHIGIKAIEKLLPSDASTRASDFVQARLTFEVRATINIRLPSYPNKYVKPKYYNTSIENMAQGIGRYPVDGNASLVTWGLLNTSATAPALNAMDVNTLTATTEDDREGSTVLRRALPTAIIPPIRRSPRAAPSAASRLQ